MLTYLDAFVPAFGLLALGVLLKRRLLPDDKVWAGIEKLIYWVLLPSLLVSAIGSLDLSTLPLGRMAVSIWVPLTVGTLLCLWLSRALGVPHAGATSVVQGGIRFNNLMGFAIIGAFYGQVGTALGGVATGLIVPCVQTVVTLIFAMAPGQTRRVTPLSVLRQLALNPLMIACVLGFTVAALGGLPPGVKPLLRSLGQATVALGLLCVGAALSLSALTDRLGLQAITTAIKLGLMPLLTWLLAQAMGLDPMSTAAAVIFMALPTAATSYVMARAMGGDAPLMAAITTSEHALSILTLPVWLWLLSRTL